jgi:hypothetical protein
VAQLPPDTVQISTAIPQDSHPRDVGQAKKVVRDAFADMRHGMDVRDEDGAPDRQAWIELELAARRLMLRAYYRNHNPAVAA